MQTEFSPHLPAAQRPIRTNTLRVTSTRLREWARDGATHDVILPRPDEDAWEDTEIDVRRTVL